MENFKKLIPIEMLMNKEHRGAKILKSLLSTYDKNTEPP
jgi:hypothetical protein